MMRHTGTGLLAAAMVLAVSACSAPLEIKNNDAPDVLRVLATPNDVKSVAGSALNTWFAGANAVDPYLMFEVTSNHATANYGNFGMRFNNEEPRTPYDNNSSSGDAVVALTPWTAFYGSLGAANDAMKAFKAGVKLTSDAETDQYKTLAMFVQALSLGELGLIFDQAFVVDENTVDKPVLQPYTAVISAAMAKYDAVIAASAGKTYTFPSAVLPLDKVTFTGSVLNRIANTMAARTLAYASRTGAENTAAPWARILAYADKGISGANSGGAAFDFAIVGDGGVSWPNWQLFNGDADMKMGALNSTWGVAVCTKTINMMAPNVPWPFTGTKVAPTGTYDKRLGLYPFDDATGDVAPGHADFAYYGSVFGNPARGIWKQSPFIYTRYYYMGWDWATSYTGTLPYTLIAENDLLIAEALARTGGDLARAATLINKTRVTRGGLTPATAADGTTKLLQYIAYEDDIELYSTGANGMYEHRRLDNLQMGTVRHLPIPAKELETLGLPIYTFGGATQNPGGK